jgi:hypothetical protein
MKEVEIDGSKYRIGKLDAKKQFHLARRLLPLLGQVGKSAKELPASDINPDSNQTVEEKDKSVGDVLNIVAGPIAEAIAKIPDDEADYIIDTCLAVVYREQGNGWPPVVSKGGRIMFEDIAGNMTVMLRLAFAVLQENLGGFFSSDQPNLTAQQAPTK